LLAEVCAALRERLRARHYSYRTEQTYAEWTRQFFAYLQQTGAERPGGRFAVTGQRVKDFITSLATRRNVAAATQNQAFSLRNPARSPLDVLRGGDRNRQ
jgi:hypothetical protein